MDSIKDIQQLAINIIQKEKENKITLKTIAKESELSEKTWERWKKGEKTQINSVTTKKLLKYLIKKGYVFNNEMQIVKSHSSAKEIFHKDENLVACNHTNNYPKFLTQNEIEEIENYFPNKDLFHFIAKKIINSTFSISKDIDNHKDMFHFACDIKSFEYRLDKYKGKNVGFDFWNEYWLYLSESFIEDYPDDLIKLPKNLFHQFLYHYLFCSEKTMNYLYQLITFIKKEKDTCTNMLTLQYDITTQNKDIICETNSGNHANKKSLLLIGILLNSFYFNSDLLNDSIEKTKEYELSKFIQNYINFQYDFNEYPNKYFNVNNTDNPTLSCSITKKGELFLDWYENNYLIKNK